MNIHKIKNTSKRHIPWLATAGYSARAVVYFTIGALALLTVFPQLGPGKGTDTKGAVTTLLDLPFGHFLLGLLSAGLLGFAIWRFYQSFTDVDHHGRSAKGLMVRSGQILSGVVNLSLSYFALNLALSKPNGEGGGTAENVAWVMSFPLGTIAVLLIGGGLIVFGGTQWKKAYSEKFLKRLRLPRSHEWSVRISKLGLAARGTVFMIVGWLVFLAGWSYSPNQAGGIDRSWNWLSQQPMGQGLTVFVAAGLMAFGFYCGIVAKHRKIH